MNLDVARLIKLLNMVGSSHDGEALNAARMAHAHLKAAGITWEQLLRGAVAPRPQAPTPPRPQPPRRPSSWAAGVWNYDVGAFDKAMVEEILKSGYFRARR